MINKLIVKNGKRFKLTGKFLVYKPGYTNIIIGNNGRGKSSLMEYLHPGLTPASSDFEDGGYRELHITVDYKDYIITNHKIKTNAHSISISDVNGTRELNNGYGRVGYLKIIEGLIHEVDTALTLGDKTFSDSSISTRKEWLSTASTVDYDYALEFFKSLSAKQRDYKGALKLIQPEIIEMVKSLNGVNEATIQKNELRINQLKGKLTELLPHTTLRPIEEIDKKIVELQSQLDDLLRLNIVSPYGEIDSITKRINMLTEAISGGKINEGDYNIAKTKYLKLKSTYELPFDTKNINKIVSSLQSEVISKHASVINSLYGKHNFNRTRTILDRYNSELTEVNTKLNTIKTSITILTNDGKKDKVECPKCESKFIPNYDAVKLNGLNVMFETIGRERDMIQSKYDKAMFDNGEATLCNNTVNILSSILRDIDYDLGRVLYIDNNILNNLSSLISTLNNFKELYELEQLIQSDTTDINITEANSEITELGRKLGILKRNVVKLKNIENIKVELTSLKDRLDDFYINKEYNVKALSNKVECDTLKATLYELESSTDTLKSRLKEINFKRETLEKQKETLVVVDKLVEGLSPKTGLIAKSLVGFINGVVSRVNNRISKIWDYKMEVLPPDLSEGGLTYKFPVNIKDIILVKDIKQCSTGQAELIDLCFQLVIKELNGDNLPLYLDEFGKNLDEIHQPKVLDFVSKLDGGQVFMITHNDQVTSGASNNNSITVCNLNKSSEVLEIS